VRSSGDPGEGYRAGDIEPSPRAVVSTMGATGGLLETAEGRSEWVAAELPGPLVDVHGAGDSFAAGLTVGLASGLEINAAIELAARCGAAAVTGRGPYEGQLAR
jgi:ribokinase